MLGPHGHADSQGRADQDVLTARVGPLVQTHDRRAALEGQAHVNCRGDGPSHGDTQHRQQTPRRPELAAEVEQEEYHRGPYDVELLLDGQGPHVLEQGGLGGGLEVIAASRDEVPVGHVEQG